MIIQKNPIQSTNYNDDYVLSEIEYQAIEDEKKHYEDARAVSIEALKIVQKQRGWVSDNAINAISKIVGIPASDIDGIATFYSHIYRTPVGRYVIRYCDSVVCYITGYENILKSLEEYLNIKPGQTTPDSRFTLLPTCCLGNCDKGPTMMVNEDTYVHLTPESIFNLLEKYQ